MVAWDKAKGKQNTGNQNKRDIERVSLGLGDTKLRLIGDVMPRYCYWVVTKDGKKMPVECLQFDRETESFNPNIKDPFKEIDADVYAEKPQFAYVCNVIDRADNKIKLFDLRSTIYSQIVDYATNPDYGSPADADNGYDLTIKKEKTGPLPQNVKYTVIPARNNSALKDSEKEMELYDLSKIFKRQTYDEQKQWLLENTTLFAGDVSNEFKPEGVDDLA
jgi:gp32 DNA binding protein like